MGNTVSLVLGSGGARGLAHIGVIRELEARGFEIKSVTGCSMGALVGGLYCAGKLDTYADWVSNLQEWDVLKFLDISLTPRAGMMKGDLIMERLRQMVGARRIEDLPIPFSAVATDVAAKKEVWFNSGDLFDVIRASIAIPGLFTPKTINGRTLVDGGLLNPLPSAPAMFTDTDITIAVSLSGLDVAEPYGDVNLRDYRTQLETYREKIDDFLDQAQDRLGLELDKDDEAAEDEMPLTDIFLNMFDTMQRTIARYRLASYPPDILVEIPGNICQTHEFYRARPLIAAGHYWARQALELHADRISGRRD